ncbi:MAG TPA: ABC-2 family transporter protein [Gemmatimonadales bacterium]|nr:ABC-2 family transporter protein [Gemmatimonadales bacterium]
MKLALVRDLITAEVRRRISYRADFWISAVSSLAVRLGVSWFIVQAVFAGSGRAGIAGYDQREMFLYYLAVILVGKLVQTTELEQSISQDIYEGGLTRHLLYPVPYGVVKYLQQLGALGPALIQILVFGAWIPFVIGFPSGLSWSGVVMGIAAIAVANLLNFLITFPIQLIAFWADNVWSLMVMHRFASALLGGMLAPLAFFPESAQRVLEALPFRYLFAFPVETLMGRVSPAEWAIGMAVAVGWCGVMALAGRAVWRRGTFQYTGVGI